MKSPHGRFRALGGRQAVAWGTSAGLAAEFYVVAGLYLPAERLAVLGSLYSLALLGTVLSALKCTIIDSADFASTHKQVVVPYTDFPKYCTICHSRVGVRSTHCEKCNHCTAGYDHHCDWLNVCIGRANYHWFFALISCVEGNLVLQTAALGIVLASVDCSIGKIVALAVVMVLNVTLALVFAYLLAFHIYISLRGLTTFEYTSLRAIQRRTRPLYLVQANQLSLHLSNSDLSVMAPPTSLQLPMDGNQLANEESSAHLPKENANTSSPQDASSPIGLLFANK